MNNDQKSPINFKIILLVTFFILLIITLIVLKFETNNQSVKNNLPINHTTTQRNFQVLSTTPKNNDTNVSNGEITIEFTTDIPIESSDSAVLSFNPKLDNSYEFISTFPTKDVKLRILGGLKPKTTYQVTIIKSNQLTYSWQFTTSGSATGLSSSALIQQIEQKDMQNNFPLAKFTPFYNSDFGIKYTSDLTLLVTITNPDIAKVKQEVNSWIRSHDVDPATHTINYINSF